ncbi:MAG TPA: hypothetical protein PKZ32_21660 [Candidatus Melainabacteria bacterium]|nr:hypothetical protein [Candidatus Melainabacteria bacterium]
MIVIEWRVKNLTNVCLRLSTALLIAAQAFTFSTAQAAPAEPSGWLLRQKHTANGEQLVYVFPEHLRVENLHLGTTVVADAHTGKAWIFSDARKTCCCVNWDKFAHTFSKILQLGGESLPHLTWTKATDKKPPPVAGLPTDRYIATDEKLYFGGGGEGFISGGGKKVLVDYTILTASKIVTSPKLLKVLSEMQTTPALPGVPLQEMSLYDKKRERIFLKTLEAKQIPDDKNLWVIPKYKQVSSITQVTSLTDSGILEDILGK